MKIPHPQWPVKKSQPVKKTTIAAKAILIIRVSNVLKFEWANVVIL